MYTKPQNNSCQKFCWQYFKIFWIFFKKPKVLTPSKFVKFFKTTKLYLQILKTLLKLLKPHKPSKPPSNSLLTISHDITAKAFPSLVTTRNHSKKKKFVELISSTETFKFVQFFVLNLNITFFCRICRWFHLRNEMWIRRMWSKHVLVCGARILMIIQGSERHLYLTVLEIPKRKKSNLMLLQVRCSMAPFRSRQISRWLPISSRHFTSHQLP